MILYNSDRYNKRRPKHRFLGAVLLLSFFGLLLSGCRSKQEEAVPTLLDPVKVKMDTETVKIDTLYNMEVFDASVVPYTEGISSEHEFEVDDIKVRIGDKVKKGQLLISMERSDYTEAYTDLKEEIDFTEQSNSYANIQIEGDIKIAKLELAQLEKNGQEKDIERKKLAIEELEVQYKYTQELQQLELNEKYSKLSKIEEKLNYPDFIAPYDGTIIYLSKIHKGDVLQPFDSVIYIADDNRISIQADYIPDRSIKNADRMYALIDGKEYDITYIPYTDEEFRYRILNELPLASKFSLKDSSSLESGTYTSICIISNYVENVMTLPKKSISNEGQGTYVYKNVNGERVRQEVEVGKSNDLRIQILSGLKEGDEVFVQ